jgi:vancomycin resistance protein YoaR
MLEKVLEPLSTEPVKQKSAFRIVAIVFGVVFGLALVVIAASIAYQQYYQNRVYPGVSAGAYQLGGMDREKIQSEIENFNNRYAREGITLGIVDAAGAEHALKLETVIAGDNAVELVRLDAAELANVALGVGRSDSYPLRLVAPLLLLVQPRVIAVPLVMDEQTFDDVLSSALAPYEEQPHNATVAITNALPLVSTVVPEKSGRIFNHRAITERVKQQVSSLSFDTPRFTSDIFTPTISVADVESITDRLPSVIGYGDLALSYIDPQTKARHDWTVKPAVFAAWIEVSRNSENALVFSLSKDAVQKYFDREVRPFTDVPAEDAKFVVDGGKVKEFQGSRNGFALDAEKTYNDFNTAFVARNYAPAEVVKTVDVSVNSAEPKITTATVNDLGITDIIGVGYSTFKDSHNNRIKNIAHAVERLNGTLIKPGEEFSANHYAGPFTAANGFLPEAVIKGNEIKNEIGGGMCQIGTTLFRMAMNSGMQITQRRNHSLVVGYYADPVNGNPGTDATLYEPILDLKFLNDTGNYLLLETNIDYAKQQLTFTLWGKPDGRSGSYTHPLVSKWIPAGAPQMIPVTTLKPGEQKCQNAFRGAVASFTYTRVTPTGEKIDQVFDSYYRPLPKICMVGTDPNAPPVTDTTVPPEISPAEPVPVP